MDGNAGAAYFTPELKEEISIPLGSYRTVYQAEVVAIIYASQNLEQDDLHHFESVKMYVGSLSTLQTLMSSNPVTELVLECFQGLHKLARHREVNLNWIPAHKGFPANEKADELAKLAARTAYVGPQPAIPVAIHSHQICNQKLGKE